MAFFVPLFLQVQTQKLVQVAVVATAVATTTYVAGRTIGPIIDSVGEGLDRLFSPSSSSSGFYLGERTIYDWWGNGLTSEGRQRLLDLGYGDRSGCFTIQELKDIICLADKAPGKPTAKDGYEPPRDWDNRLKKAPNSEKKGYPHRDGSVWVPTGRDTDNVGQHGGPHWDVQYPNGGHRNVYPGGKSRWIRLVN